MKSYKFGAIDIGSNAVRLLITEIIESNSIIRYKKRLFVRIPIRLGEDVFSTNRISFEKAKQLKHAMLSFNIQMKLFDVNAFKACGTSALRNAENGQAIIDEIKKETEIEINRIDGQEEAKIIYSNHIAETLNHNKSYLYIDVGGGSTELTFFSNNTLVTSCSVPIGTIRLLQDNVAENTWDQLKKFTKSISEQSTRTIGIGTGGNINKLYKLVDKKDGKFINWRDIKKVYTELEQLSIEERIEKYALNSDRADVIVPAAKLFLLIMKWANIETVYVPKLGLVDGIIHQLHEKTEAVR